MKTIIQRFFSPLLGCLLATSVFTSTDAGAEDTKPTILVVGDSLGVGLGSYIKKLGALDGYRVVTASIGGTNTQQWSHWLPRKVSEVKPAAVFVSLGTNDSGLWGKQFLSHPETVTSIVNTVRDARAQLVWIGVPTLPKKSLPLRDKVVELLKTHTPLYLDSTESKGERSGDEVHFTPKGYETWASEIWRASCDAKAVVCAETSAN